MTWKKGQSGNPGGISKIERDIIQYARSFSKKAVDALVGILDEPNLVETEKGTINMCSAKAKAAELLLDRGLGKAPQHTSVALIDKRSPVEYTEEELDEIIRAGDEGAQEGAHH